MTEKTLKQRLITLKNKKWFRVGVLIALLIILLAMYFIGGKMKTLLLVLMVLVVWALGLQITDYDLDIATLWDTWSIQESRVETKKWVRLIGKCLSDNVNCANFATQDEAQAMYEDCAAQIKANNSNVDGIDEIKNIDVYGLDGDKDGIVCEALPAA